MLTEAEERALQELAAATAAVDRRFARRLSAGPFGRRDRIRRAVVVVSAAVGAGTLDTVLGSRSSAVAAALGLAVVVALAVAAALLRARVGLRPGRRPARLGA
jgi:hypothetical protein